MVLFYTSSFSNRAEDTLTSMILFSAKNLQPLERERAARTDAKALEHAMLVHPRIQVGVACKSRRVAPLPGWRHALEKQRSAGWLCIECISSQNFNKKSL